MNKTIEQLGMYFFDLITFDGKIRAIRSKDIPEFERNGAIDILQESGITVIMERNNA